MSEQIVVSTVDNSHEELPESVKLMFDIEHTKNIYVQHNNTPSYLQIDEKLKYKGVIIENIVEATHNHPELVEKYFMQDGVKVDENKLTAFHTAMLNGG